MADQGCRKELNRQLQTLQARVKSLEDNVAGLNETTITNIAQTAAGFAALVTEGMVTGLPTYIANQLILKLAAVALGMAEDALENFPGIGAAGDLMASASAIEDAIKDILKILSTPAFDWKKFQFQLMIPSLTIPPYGAMFINAALASAENLVSTAQAALAADPLNAQLQAALTQAINLRDSMSGAANAMDNLTACKIATSVLGL